MRAFACLVVGLAAFFAMQACLDPTQATLVITTNVDCGPEIPAKDTLFETGLNAAASPEAASADLATTTRACSPQASGIHDVGEIVVFPEDGASQASVIVVGALDEATTAERCLEFARTNDTSDPTFDPESCIVARRTVVFAAHTMLDVPILLDRYCAGVPCAKGTTCVRVGQGEETTCADDKPPCKGPKCDDPRGGGEPVGGAAAGGGGGGSNTEPIPIDCGTYVPIHEPQNEAAPPTAIFGLSADNVGAQEILVARRNAMGVPQLAKLSGGQFELLRPLASAGLSIHGVRSDGGTAVGVAEAGHAEFFELDGAADTLPIPAASTDVFVASSAVAYFVNGGDTIAIVTLPDESVDTYAFGPLAVSPKLRAVTAAGGRAFAVGTHICWGDDTMTDCSNPFATPLADAWAINEAELLGVTTLGLVSLVNVSGVSLGTPAQLPITGSPPVQATKAQGMRLAGQPSGPLVFWVAGTAGPEGDGYIARGTKQGVPFDWAECRIPGKGPVTDFWVSADEATILFITSTGVYRLDPDFL